MNSFDPKATNNNSVPYSGLILLNPKGTVISSTIAREFLTKLKIEGHPICLNSINNKKFFELKIAPIRQGLYVGEPVIPMSMHIANPNQINVGTICGALIVRELNEKLKLLHTQARYIKFVEIQNIYAHTDHNYAANDIDKVFTISTLIKNYIQNKNITVLRNLQTQPFAIEIQIKPEYLKRFLGIEMLLYFLYTPLFIIFSFLLWLITKNFFQNSLHPTYIRLKLLHNSIKTPSNQALTHKFCPINFATDVDELINKHHSLRLHMEVYQTTYSELEIKKKVLNLILTEQHFLPFNRSVTTTQEQLYLNKLISLIQEQPSSSLLNNFLNQVAGYCSEFYYEFNIKVVVHKKDQKDFSFKHAALTEAIFHIFTFISRGAFDADGTKIILRGAFVNKNSFPSITIEVPINNDSLNALGWSSGPSYVYTSLLSIHLLARESKLFFNIANKENKMLFTLEPIDKKVELYNQVLDLK